MVTADKVLFCFLCRQRLLSVCQITDFQIDDILNPSKNMHFNPCVSWGGGCLLIIQVLFLFGEGLSLASSLCAQACHKSHLTNLLAILVLYCHTQLLLWPLDQLVLMSSSPPYSLRRLIQLNNWGEFCMQQVCLTAGLESRLWHTQNSIGIGSNENYPDNSGML